MEHTRKSANWFMTVNNPKQTIQEFFELLRKDAVFARVQEERGAEGTHHYQACVGYKSQRHFLKLQKSFPGAHIERSKNAMASWTYCGKEETRVEGTEVLSHGVPPAAKNVKGDTATRNKMLIAKGPKACVDEGLIPLEKLPLLQKAMHAYTSMEQHPTLEKLEHEWHWGPTGTGKSHHVRTTYPDAYLKTNTKWWDGYTGQETVIIEEMAPEQIGGHHFKQWADKYPFPAEVKGGVINLRPKRIIITSNYTIQECWLRPQDHEPILRRFTVHHHNKPFGK